MDIGKYSILIIAFECHYSHVDRFIKFLKQVNPLVEITLFADEHVITDGIRISVDEIIYKKRAADHSGIKIRGFSKFLNKITLFKQIKDLSKVRKFDIINIHFTQYYMCFVMSRLHLMSNSIILTPWGSDILRVKSKFKLFFLKQTYRKADKVTVGPHGAVGRIINKEFGVDEKRMVPLAWGSETIDFINDHLASISKQEAKRKISLEDKYIITCGYNAFPEQRHAEIIVALSRIKEHLPSNLMLVFPVTYGTESRKAAYISVLKSQCEMYGLPAVFYDHYLSVEDTFFLRRASDIFIHVQTTDAGNSTIMEYLICGNKVIHGSWMQYKWLDYPPLFYFPVHDIDDLSAVILNAVESEDPIIPEEVLTIIRNRGWKRKMMDWNEFFWSCISQ